jgi:ferritin-like metal-binding protein YciE
MNHETMQELFLEQLRDIYDAEKQLVKALPKLAKAAESEELAEALTSHLEETQNHVQRVEQIFQIVKSNAKSKPCKGMRGLIEEGNEAVQEKEEGTLRDLAIVAGCQKVEHYEISAYGTIRTLAEQLEMEDVVELLQQTEDEESQADEKLTEVASGIYESDAGEEQDEEENTATPAPARRSSTATKSAGKASR